MKGAGFCLLYRVFYYIEVYYIKARVYYNSVEPEEDSYVQCRLKKIMECAVNKVHQNKSCNCIPEGKYKTYFQLYPTLSFKNNSCITDKIFSPIFAGNPNKTINENRFCNYVMLSCYRQLRSSCPISCEKIEYTVQKSDRKRIANRVDVKLQFASTDIAMRF